MLATLFILRSPASAGDVPLGDGTLTAIAADEEHTCVLVAGGAVRCWGTGAFGRLGYGNDQTIVNNEAAGVGGDVPF